jgi:hypothetical protein
VRLGALTTRSLGAQDSASAPSPVAALTGSGAAGVGVGVRFGSCGLARAAWAASISGMIVAAQPTLTLCVGV